MTTTATAERHATSRGRKALTDPFRVLAMDGGGIYGLFTVLMLKELCKGNPNFLRGDDVDLFAGTSAGGLIALALAGAQNPRDIILSGHLEAFFSDRRLYSRNAGVGMLAGAMGLSSWTGRKNVEALFRDYFGDWKLGDLYHRVLVSTFDMYGDPDEENKQKWKPRVYYNFPRTEENRDLAVSRVAYGVAAPVMWRPVVNGRTDGGIFADSPSVMAIAKIIQYFRDIDVERDIPLAKAKEKFSLDATLGQVRLLSLGVGNRMPHYGMRDFDLGYLSFSLLPTNLRKLDIWPPMFYLALDPQVESSNFEAKQFLGEHFMRLDPGVLRFPIPPVLASMYLSAFSVWREFILKHIRKGMDNRETGAALHATSQWLERVWRTAEHADPRMSPRLSDVEEEED